MRRSTGTFAALVLASLPGGLPAAGHLDWAGQVVGRHADQVVPAPLAAFGGVPARLLREAADGALVAVAELPAGWQWQPPPAREQALELLVLEGELGWGPVLLPRHGYAHLPVAAPAPPLSTVAPARVLMFLDPPRASDGGEARVVMPADDWRPGVVAERDTGVALALEVRDLLWVPETGQRTWLLRSDVDFSLPWERHTTVEEGMLLEGEWRMGECGAAGAVITDYRPGGYFFRPPGILHGGPATGSPVPVLFVLRTPTALTVEFAEDCVP